MWFWGSNWLDTIEIYLMSLNLILTIKLSTPIWKLRFFTLSILVRKLFQPHQPPPLPPSVPLHSTKLRPWRESEMSLFSPPSIPSSLAVFLLNRCQRWVKSSPEGLPAAYWFIINEIRAAVCRGGFSPSVGLTPACQEDRRRERSKRTDRDRRMLLDHRPKKTMDWTYSGSYLLVYLVFNLFPGASN